MPIQKKPDPGPTRQPSVLPTSGQHSAAATHLSQNGQPSKQSFLRPYDPGFFEMPLAQEQIKDARQNQALFKRFAFSGIALVFLTSLAISGIFLFKNSKNIQSEVMAQSSTGKEHLLLAQNNLLAFNFENANKNFETAYSDFNRIDNKLSSLGQSNVLISKMPGANSSIFSGEKLVSVAKDISFAGKEISSAATFFNNFSILDEKKVDSWYPFDAAKKKLLSAQKSISRAQENLAFVNPKALPGSENLILDLKNKLPAFKEFLNVLVAASGDFPEILGKDKPQKFLLLFQNPAEQRATGGFLGNYGTLIFDKGQMIGPKVEDIYKLQWLSQGKREVIKPPEEIYQADIRLWQKSKWEIWDANWAIDFPTTAKKMEWYYEQYDQGLTDGVIAIDPIVFSEVLKITGPIKLKKYNVTATSENFWRMMEVKVEADNPFKKGLASYGEANPKQILKDFAPLFMDKIKNAGPEQKKKIFEAIVGCIQQKHILLFANAFNIENLFAYLNINGQVKDAPVDYLYFNESNVGVNKSSNRISEDAQLNVNIENGKIKNQLILFRKHNGNPKNQRSGTNITYFRFLIPSDSELNSMTINGKDVAPEVILGKESGKTKFGIKTSLHPQKSQRIILEYTLPFNVSYTSLTPFNYSLYVQKQPGRIKDGLNVSINYPKNSLIENIIGPVDAQKNQNQLRFQTDLRTDKIFRLILKK